MQDSIELLETTLHSLSDALISTDNRGSIIHMNSMAERLTGWRIDEAMSKPLADVFKVIHVKNQKFVENLLKHIQGEEQTVFLTDHSLLIAKDGSEYQIAYTASPIKKTGQKIAGMVVVFRDVTAERRIETSLKESNEQLRALIASIQSPVFTLDTRQRYTYIYGPWMREHGFTPERFIGRTAQEVMGEENARAHREANERALKGEHVVYEWSAQKTKKQVYYEISLSPIRDQGGVIQGLIGMGRDITKRKKAELALEQRESFLQLVMDTLPIGIAAHSIDPNAPLQWMNKKFLPCFGIQKDNIYTLKNLWENILEDGECGEELKTRILADIASGDPGLMRWESIPITREEEKKKTEYITAKTTPIPNSNLLISTVWDVTEHKKTKDKIEKNIEYLSLLLQASESLSRSLNLSEILQIFSNTAIELLEMDSAAIYLLEHEKLYLSATIPPLPKDFPEALRQAPLEDHPHIGEAIKTSSPVILPDTTMEDLTEAERAIVAMRNLRTIVYLPLLGSREVLGVLIVGSAETPCRVLESQLTHCRTLGTQAAIAVENARLYLSLQNEISERKQAKEELQKAKDELEERVLQRTAQLEEAKKEAIAANHAKSEFLYKMSHELRTPLHAILSYSDLGLEDMNEGITNDVKEYFKNIYSSGNRLLVLIEDLLDLSRIEVGSIEYKFEQKDLYEVVVLSKEEMSALLEGKDITLKIKKPPFSTLVKLDSNRMLQVLRNLIYNAIKFTPRKRSIYITFTQNVSTSPTLATHIIDEGPGIAPEDLECIFEKFTQSYRDGQKREGTGLGLAICREIIQAHDGFIYAENKPNQGAKITFELPVSSNE